jgi:hypothetical protein
MAYVITNPLAGSQPIATTSTVKNHPLGTIVSAVDPTYGSGEFIYLEGAANTIVGSVVTYVNSGSTTLGTTSGVVNGGAPVAVAMSANIDTQYGWYQISGDAVIKKTAVKVDPAGTTKVYLSATAGRVMQTSVAGRQVLGARWTTATTVTSTTSTAVATLNRPMQQGAIT